MAQIYYVSLVGRSGEKPSSNYQVSKAFPTWLGCKRVLNRFRRFHPSLAFRLVSVDCYLHMKDVYLKQYSNFYNISDITL